MADLVCDSVTKVFSDQTRAVCDLSLEVAAGEFVVLVGPSGCGKSTLLRMIAGLESVTAGEIRIGGRRVNETPPKDRDIAMVFQNYALYPHMSVYQNMAFGLKMRRLPKERIDRRVREAAATLGLTHLLRRRSGALSGGQQQRVALGRAIVREPQLFLFDEPLSNLDAKLRVAMRGELIRLHRRLGATMLYVTHDQSEAMSMAQRLVILRDGVIQQIGTPLEVYRHPVNRFVAGFLGSPAMNFIDGRIDDGLAVRLGDALVLPLTVSQQRALAALADRPAAVVIGIRPEDLDEAARAPAGATGQRLTVTVDYLEPMGNEVLATCELAGTPLVVRLDPSTAAAAGQELELLIEPGRLKLFHPATDEAIV